MKRYYILVLAMLVVASCNKKPVVTLSRADMLRTGRWTLSSGTLTLKLPNGRDTTLNYMNFVPKCHLDDYIMFGTGNTGYTYAGAIKCNAGDPDSTEFQWTLSNNNNAISLYNGFEFTYSVVETILPFVFDTTQQSPYLVLDTIAGVFDTTAPYTKSIIELDTIWNLQFDSTSIPDNQIANATITNFSQTSMTIYYTVYSTFPDSLYNHTNQLIIPGVDTVDYNPILQPDTFKFLVTYTNS